MTDACFKRQKGPFISEISLLLFEIYNHSEVGLSLDYLYFWEEVHRISGGITNQRRSIAAEAGEIAALDVPQ